MSAPFIDPNRPELGYARLVWCQDCQSHYWSDYQHDCPAYDPLAGARGIVYALCACGFVYALLVAAGVIRFGWRP